MDFLKHGARPKVLRTTLYEDQEFTRFELEILHTPLYQRLYELKQLGYSDKVFPDAVHSRFNHLLGVTEIAGRMADRVGTWLEAHTGEIFTFAHRLSNRTWANEEITAAQLRQHVLDRRPVVRLMALLHDLTHAAFGHTLEDEVAVFSEKHDAPERQIRFFDALTAQIFTIWAIECEIPNADFADLQRLSAFEIDKERIVKLARALFSIVEPNQVAELSLYLQHLELSFRLLLCLDGAHLNTNPNKRKTSEEEDAELVCGQDSSLLLSDIMAEVHHPVTPLDIVVHRDMFLIDLVGNTICADLIDYARRDTANSGLKVSFDERLLRYLCLVSVQRDLVPGGRPAIRVAMQVFTDKLRHDVLSEMSSLLKARYLISERITFHPTKCAAGACLGTAVQLIGLVNMPRWVQALGDQSFLALIMRIAEGIPAYADRAKDVLAQEASIGGEKDQNLFERMQASGVSGIVSALWPADPQFRAAILGCINQLQRDIEQSPEDESLISLVDRADAARRILWKLSARRYPKLAYRLHGNHSSGRTDTVDLAFKYNNPKTRFDFERQIERMCQLPLGTIHVHCPLPTTSMKVAHALVVGNDLTKVTHLRTLTTIYRDTEQLRPYEKEILAIEEMYKSIWRMNIYMDVAVLYKQALVAHYAHRVLGLENDPLLDNGSDDEPVSAENEYDILVARASEFAPDDLPLVVQQLDHEHVSVRHRGVEEDFGDRVTAAIEKVRMMGHNKNRL